jgi:hypothetical protein
MDVRITGLDPAPFRDLFGCSDDELIARGVKRYAVDAEPGFPDRVSLRDLPLGASALLLNYTHLDVDSPYRSSHAIFVAEDASVAYDAVNEVPLALRRRDLSLRAFDRAGWMRDASLTSGTALEEAVAQLFRDDAVAFVHAHYAVRGCYAARIERA